MTRILLTTGLLLAIGAGGIAQDASVQVEGWLHSYVDPDVQTIAPVHALYVDGPSDASDAARRIQMTLVGSFERPSQYEGLRVRLTGEAPLGPPIPDGRIAPFETMTVTDIEIIGGAPLAEVIRADFEARDIDIFGDGTDEPVGGLDAETLRCANGDLALSVPAYPPGPVHPDQDFSDVFVCSATSQYWVHRTGGFAGVDLWVGPFPVPATGLAQRQEAAPTRITPRRVRLRRNARTVRMSLRRRADSEQPVSLYVPSDFDFGEGVTVERVRRAGPRRIRLHVTVQPDAQRGRRTARLMGRSGNASFRIARRR